MAQTSSIYDHFTIWPTSMALTFNLPELMFQMALLLLKENNCAKLFWNPCINVGVMARTSSLYVTFKCGLDLQPTWKKVSYGIFHPHGQQVCQIILKSMHECGSYGPDKSGWMHALMQAHTPNKNCSSFVSLHRKWAWMKLLKDNLFKLHKNVNGNHGCSRKVYIHGMYAMVKEKFSM